MARLSEYRRKRDFQRTPEPAGETRAGAGGDAGRFVIHKHASRRPHYDLRLEQDGVLRSWALPKGPSLTAGEKRLAVEVEDHPLEYADFEGVIPAGAYGAGTIMLWDRGRWRHASDAGRDGTLDILLEGSKLRGRWTLARIAGRDEDGSNWLMIKRRDRGPEAPAPDDRSVLTGRSMDEITRQAEDAATAAPPPDGRPAEHGDPDDGEDEGSRERGAGPNPAALAGARRAQLAGTAKLQLATLVSTPPEGEAWLHEIKLDGYRVAARVAEANVQLFTRNGHDWTARFPAIAAALAGLPARRALLDGEVVALGADGVSSFRALQEALSTGRSEALVYHAFDLLHLDEYDLRDVTQIDRKVALARLLQAWRRPPTSPVRYTDHLVGKGSAFLAKACALGLEGIVSKRSDARYLASRGRRWLKTKCTLHEDLVVGGYTAPRGTRSGFGALLLGALQDGALIYAGRVGSGFGERQLRRLLAELEARRRPTSPFEGPVPDARSVTWVEPELVVEVAFTERTRDGRLRHPTFRGLRDDKDPAEVVAAPREAGAAAGAAERTPRDAERGRAGPGRQTGQARAPARPDRGSGGNGRGRTSRGRGGVEVAGVHLTNPDRVLYPEQGITKLALAHYYEGVQTHVLPGLRRRPLALVRCPQGHDEQCFYQKHPGDGFAPSLPRVTIAGKEAQGRYAYVETLADLIGLVQLGVLELHVWGCRVDDVERPDQLVLDLDPGDDVPWAETLATARSLHERLADLGLTSFLRTTGGKGLHLVVPLAGNQGWDDVKAFARAVCERHAAEDPRRRTTNMSMARRRGRIFLDYLRNGRGATAIASYSTRARSGAPVAVPIRWDELSSALRSDRYDVDNVRRRLAALGADPWHGFEAARRGITSAMRAAVGLTPDAAAEDR
jgi:bifunctional non-homologous end joining protein LigD